MNYNFHQSLDEKCHRFLNAVEPGTKVEIHRHPTKDESCVLLRGRVRVNTYNDDGTVASVTPNCPEAKPSVRKRVVVDLNNTYDPEDFPVPYTEVIFDRIMLEIMRGCTRGCRFCQAGILYRPVRERSMEKLICLAEKLQNSIDIIKENIKGIM